MAAPVAFLVHFTAVEDIFTAGALLQSLGQTHGALSAHFSKPSLILIWIKSLPWAHRCCVPESGSLSGRDIGMEHARIALYFGSSVCVGAALCVL